MASSSSSGHSHHSPFGPAISEKLTRENFLLWKAQIMPGIRAAQYEGYLDGSKAVPAATIELVKEEGKPKITTVNPEYERWIKEDQLLLDHINNSLSREILAQVATKVMSAQVWSTLGNMFSAQSQARVTNLRMQLANCKKGGQIATAYYAKVKALGDELAAARRPVPDEELVTFILAAVTEPPKL